MLKFCVQDQERLSGGDMVLLPNHELALPGAGLPMDLPDRITLLVVANGNVIVIGGGAARMPRITGEHLLSKGSQAVQIHEFRADRDLQGFAGVDHSPDQTQRVRNDLLCRAQLMDAAPAKDQFIFQFARGVEHRAAPETFWKLFLDGCRFQAMQLHSAYFASAGNRG